MTVTFTPFGAPCEYSCSGWRPTGSSFSCVAPAIGRLMFSNLPPLGLFQLQTLGGVYSGASVIPKAPGCDRAWITCVAGGYTAQQPGRIELGCPSKASDAEARAYSAAAARLGVGSSGNPG